jgi:signal transduction histidine kinase
MAQKWKPALVHLSRALFAAAITVILAQFPFDYIESFTYDLRVRLAPPPKPSGLIETVVVDFATMKELGRAPSANDFREVLEKLSQAGADTIISFINLSETVGSLDESRLLAESAQKIPRFMVALDDVPLEGEQDALKLSSPFERVQAVSAPVPIDRNIFARDDVTRRIMLAYQGLPTVYPLIAARFRDDLKLAGDPSDSENRYRSANFRGVFDYLKSDQAFVKFAPTGTYQATSFLSILNGSIDLSRYTNKIVIIGRDIQTTSRDYVRTPYSRDVVAMTIVELAANSLETLIQDTAPTRAPKWINTIITGAISYFTVIVVLTATPTTGLILLGSVLAVYFAISVLALWLGGYWVGVAHPFMAIFICYYFFIPYRLIIENRRSWEYYQKNKLLTQVEELKTNFLSMMSHDLKTPIARIQGMADVVRNDSNPLSPRQKEAIETLKRSSDELLEFVSGILSLGRIESKAIQLHLHSKDINALVHEVITKLDYLARSKRIEVRAELEPLFSIRMDVDLIRQVLQNLIENAIKYSPEGSSILVTSEERDGHIVVQVADQGPGIPEDELPHIFMKFYRSRNAKGSSIKGSGLGLYLAKYFVELHKGRVSVDSTLGQGSTFTVELPSD